MKAVILHGHEDAAYAEQAMRACAMLEPLPMIVTPKSSTCTCGPQIVVVIIWSQAARAAGLVQHFAKAVSGGCGSVVWTVDDAPPFPGAATHALSRFAKSMAITGAVKAAISRAAQEARDATRPRRLSAAPSIAVGVMLGMLIGFGGAGLSARDNLRAHAEARSNFLTAQTRLAQQTTLASASEAMVRSMMRGQSTPGCSHLLLQPITSVLNNRHDFSWLSEGSARCAKPSPVSAFG
jgi:hypothetical protein